jgi:hypothetical protein
VSYAFTNWLTGFVEYDFYGFGKVSDNFVCGPLACVAGFGTAFPVDRKE